MKQIAPEISKDSRDIKAVLLDIDGVLVQRDDSGVLRAIEGAASTLDWLDTNQIPYLCVTNTSSRSRHTLADLLQQAGLQIPEQNIQTPALAAREYIAHQKEPILGLFVTNDTAREFSEFRSSDSVGTVNMVVLGDMLEQWNIDRFNLAFQMILAGADWICLGKTRFYRKNQASKNEHNVCGLVMDVGPMAAALEFATGKPPIVMGKPQKEFFESAVRKLDVDVSQALMIGDDVISDIMAAKQAGLLGLLVKTGKFQETDLQYSDIEVMNSIGDLPIWWRGVRGAKPPEK